MRVNQEIISECWTWISTADLDPILLKSTDPQATNKRGNAGIGEQVIFLKSSLHLKKKGNLCYSRGRRRSRWRPWGGEWWLSCPWSAPDSPPGSQTDWPPTPTHRPKYMQICNNYFFLFILYDVIFVYFTKRRFQRNWWVHFFRNFVSLPPNPVHDYLDFFAFN